MTRLPAKRNKATYVDWRKSATLRPERPQPLSPLQPILRLQQNVGNWSVAQLLRSQESQERLTVSRPDDIAEREAERVADQMERGADQFNDHNACRTKIEAGDHLPPSINAFFKSRFNYDISGVRIHNDARATEAAESLNARAFTLGNDIVFGAGQFAPATAPGRRLLAHELTHVMQQSRGVSGLRGSASPTSQAASGPTLQRAPKDKGGESDAKPRATSFKKITMHFDGAELIVSGDGKEIFRYSAQSGRPVRLTQEHAKQCGADVTTDSYMNDKRFVGVTDFGPIPEGAYTFSAPSIERFSSEDQRRLVTAGILGAHDITVGGHRIHAGDWGSGRVALNPRGRLREGPCGNANARSGFFLHGGILAGSSGCIDIGGRFDELADFLDGYPRPITVTVAYEREPPSIGFFTGLSGFAAYGRAGFAHGPSLRLGAEFAPTGPRALTSVGYDAVLQWAGGALSAGVRLDIPFNNQEAFVRAGLSGGVNFRILRGLYGQLLLGYSSDITGPERGSGLELGAGLRYDFGQVQLEALYNALRPASEDQRVHQALLGLGFRF